MFVISGVCLFNGCENFPMCRFLARLAAHTRYSVQKDLIYIMKYRLYGAALAACVMLSGCSSTESRPEVSASMEDLVSAGSTSVTTATGDVESQVPQAEKPDSTSGEATTSSVQVPTAEVTTTPDADSDFDIFYSEVHEQFDLSEEELASWITPCLSGTAYAADLPNTV